MAAECDICVIGGSCTGVFAAVRAARLGFSVVIVEQNTIFGGMATAAQVNEWHSLKDALGQEQIIGGLTVELLDILRANNAVRTVTRPRGEYHIFNSAEMALELDALVRAHSIRPFLKASCVGAVREGNRIDAAIIEDKSGRRAIRAKMYIDASGDGDLLRRAGFEAWKNEHLQPVTYQALYAGLESVPKEKSDIWRSIEHLLEQHQYPTANGRPWINSCGFDGNLRNVYAPRLNGVDASDADQLTAALLESRRCHRALVAMIREIGGEIACVGLAQAMGVRETWHAASKHRLQAEELLWGKSFDDAIGYGTYPVDIHSASGTILRYMDGREEDIAKDGSVTWRRWREEGGNAAAYYQIPYGSLVPKEADNLLVAGRLLDAEREAFGGVRVMVNMNQTGEAAGTAACLAIRHEISPRDVAPGLLRSVLVENGSVFPSPERQVAEAVG